MDLAAWLAKLSALHGLIFGAVEPLTLVRELTMVVYPHPESGAYVLPVRELWALPNLAGDVAVDLVVEFSDQPGVIARGRLEDAPMEVVLLNPAALPAWLGR